MKKSLAAALLAAALPALWVSPAGAAVPKRSADDTIACGKKAASVWFDGKHLAAKNPCTQWLHIVMSYETPDRGNDYMGISVAPGAHFNVRLAKLDLSTWSTGYERAELADSGACGITFLKNSKGKPTDPC